jgi:chaperonin GroES
MIRPLQDRVLVKPSIRQLSEILIVNNKESFNMGTVVAVGPGKRDKRGNVKSLDAKPGDFIRYGNGDYLKWPTIKHEGQEYQIIQEADICWIERELDAA